MYDGERRPVAPYASDSTSSFSSNVFETSHWSNGFAVRDAHLSASTGQRDSLRTDLETGLTLETQQAHCKLALLIDQIYANFYKRLITMIDLCVKKKMCGWVNTSAHTSQLASKPVVEPTDR